MFRYVGQAGGGPLMSNVRPQRNPNALPFEQEFRGSPSPVRLTRALRADALRRAVSPNKFLVSASSRPNSTLALLGRVKNGSVLEGEQLSHNEGTKLELEAR
jgi:hypothetical protein